jgi:type I restriction enzyme R subunit
VENAYNQIQHYKLDIPELFVYNAITILSDGSETLHGMYSSDIQWYAPWKSVHGDDITNDEDLQLETMIQGLFPKETLLSYLKHFIFHEDHNSKIIKKGAKYHQYWGVTKAVTSAKQSLQPLGDGKIGVIWHTQGSGKSISMAMLTGILRQLPVMKNPTILVQVDRSALDTQLYENFVLAKDLVGDVQQADSTDDLRKLLSAGGGGVVFSTIEKFRLKDLESGKEEEHPILSERYNVIVMADEAHRTQYGFKDGGYAQNLRRALPNASFIGFTGTPVDGKDQDTEMVFGPTIHTYDIKQAVIDGATVPIHYEPKMVPLNIKGDYAQELESVVQEENDQNTVWAAVEDAAGAKDRVNRVASNIIQHFSKRIEALPGKAMVVCMSRRNCVKVYDALMEQEGCPEIAVIMTSNISKDPKEWNTHVRTKSKMEAIKKRFKDPDDPLSIVIVRDMWLTGFDAPCCHTMYLDKIMKGHNLMQAIARVNRVFKDKKNGLVVDFIGISSILAKATKKYTAGGGKGRPSINIEEVVEICLKQFNHVKSLLGDFTLEELEAMSAGEQTKWFSGLVNGLLASDSITDNFLQEELKLKELVSMCNSHKRIWPIQEEVAIIQKFRQHIRKIKYPPAKKREKNNYVKDLISKALGSQQIVNLAEMYDLDEIDISIIDTEFQAIVKEEGEENIKIELLRRIINDELRVKAMTNISKMTNLKAELEKVLSSYHQNSLDSIAAIKHLLDIAEELQNESKRAEELGLAGDELAFYDLLVENKDILNVEGPIQDLVQKVVKSLKKNLHLDWTKKEEAKAAIRIEIRRELRGVVPFSELDNLLKVLLEQAEGQYRDYPLVG